MWYCWDIFHNESPFLTVYVAASVDAEPTIKDANVMPAVTDNTFFRVKIENLLDV